MTSRKPKIEIIKVETERPSCRPKRFPPQPIMYLELLENKEKIKQELVNKEYVPPILPPVINIIEEEFKPESPKKEFKENFKEKIVNPSPKKSSKEVVSDEDSDSSVRERKNKSQSSDSDIDSLSDSDGYNKNQRKKKLSDSSDDSDDEQRKRKYSSSSSSDDESERRRDKGYKLSKSSSSSGSSDNSDDSDKGNNYSSSEDSSDSEDELSNRIKQLLKKDRSKEVSPKQKEREQDRDRDRDRERGRERDKERDRERGRERERERDRERDKGKDGERERVSEKSSKSPLDDRKQAPSLKELEKNGQYQPKKVIPDITNSYQTEAEKDDLKRELLFKFEILKKSYNNVAIPEFTIHSDYEHMLKTYNATLKKVEVDSSVDSYKTYLIGGFMLVEFVLGNWFNLDMQGFTQQQIVSMNSYEKLLFELGEKSYVPTASKLPVEVRLLIMIVVNAGFFIVTKMLMKKTGANLLNMINGMGGPKPSAGVASSGDKKRKMQGPNISFDEIPDAN